MSWAVIIAALLEVLGPVLQDLLRQLLDRWLTRAARTLPDPGDSMQSNLDDLFDRALDQCRWWQFGRVALLERARSAALRRSNAVAAFAAGDRTVIPEAFTEAEQVGFRTASAAMAGELLMAE